MTLIPMTWTPCQGQATQNIPESQPVPPTASKTKLKTWERRGQGHRFLNLETTDYRSAETRRFALGLGGATLDHQGE